MVKKARTGRKAELASLEEALLNNGQAIQSTQKKKNWTKHDLKTITPLTPTQEEAFHAWFNDNHLCLNGSPGTGKSFLALYFSLLEIFEQRQSKIIIVRSAVPSRDIGYLPGTLSEKTAMYELPYQDILWELIGRNSTYTDMKEARIIEFMTTSFIRGLTWDNAIVIVDECQNLTDHEIYGIMTRIGKNTRVILTGDIKQTDLDGKKNGISGFANAIKIISKMKHFANIKFTRDDIVRSEFVKEWIIASEDN